MSGRQQTSPRSTAGISQSASAAPRQSQNRPHRGDQHIRNHQQAYSRSGSPWLIAAGRIALLAAGIALASWAVSLW